MPKGVQIEELSIGDGTIADKRATVLVRYDGYLNGGELFQKDMKYRFNLARRDVFAGLRYGVMGMRVGGKRKLRVKPYLAYGEQGVRGIIPANALLVLEVELLEVDSTLEEEVE